MAGWTHEQACGATPLNGLLALARQRGLHIEQLEHCNSGDTGANSPRGRQSVVGYASFALFDAGPDPLAGADPGAQGLSDEQGARLVRMARSALHAALRAPRGAPAPDADLQAPGATFVTLTQDGQCAAALAVCRRTAPWSRTCRPTPAPPRCKTLVFHRSAPTRHRGCEWRSRC
jgi:hypothetical protein